MGHTGKQVKDMCSGINALFHEAGEDEAVGVGDEADRRSAAVYSVIHMRYFEGHGAWMLRRTANKTGCDPAAAQEMTPEYVKAILAPRGMLAHPIVVITDHQRGSQRVIGRLRDDPDLGPRLRLVPAEACWLGGDMMLAVMVRAVGAPRVFPPRDPVPPLKSRRVTNAGRRLHRAPFQHHVRLHREIEGRLGLRAELPVPRPGRPRRVAPRARSPGRNASRVEGAARAVLTSHPVPSRARHVALRSSPNRHRLISPRCDLQVSRRIRCEVDCSVGSVAR